MVEDYASSLTTNRQGAKDAKKEPPAEVDALANAVIGAAIEVHRILGPGYLESVYEAALGVEFVLRTIPYSKQRPIPVEYKGREVGEGRLDFLVDERRVVELKAVEMLGPIQRAQVISYLEAMNLQLGLLLNFNVIAMRHGIVRVVRS